MRFFDIYEVVRFLPAKALTHKEKWGDKTHGCRFCLRTEPDVKFGDDTHLIPAFMGNRYLLSGFECVECNHRFDKAEDHLSRFLQPTQAIQMVEGRQGSPTFKRKLSATETEPEMVLLRIAKEGTDLEIKAQSEANVVEFDEESKRLKIRIKKDSFVPVQCMRALVKVAYSVFTLDEVSGFELLRAWLYAPEECQKSTDLFGLPLLQVTILGAEYMTSVIVFKKKPEHADTSYPAFSASILFANQMLHFPLPFYEDDVKKINSGVNLHLLHPELPITPEQYKDVRNPFGRLLEMNSNSVIKGLEEVLEFEFDSAKRVI